MKVIVVLSIVLGVAAQEELAQVPVDLIQNCIQCCAAADILFDADIRLFACQEGCANNIGAIDAEDEDEQTSFDVGLQFLTVGQTAFTSGVQDFLLLCTPGAELEAIQLDADGNAEEVLEAVCQGCCTDINTQFDNGVNNGIDDLYSVDSCINSGCLDDFENIDCSDGGDAELRDELGCDLGQLFRTSGGTSFRGFNHVCTAAGLKTFGAVQVVTCESCCADLQADLKDDLNLVACQNEGCGGIDVCAESLLDQESCDIGRQFLLDGISNVNGNVLQCFFDSANIGGASLRTFVDFNIENNDLALEEVAGITIGSIAGVALIAGAFILFRRRRARMNGGMGGNSSAPMGPPPGFDDKRAYDSGGQSYFGGGMSNYNNNY